MAQQCGSQTAAQADNVSVLARKTTLHRRGSGGSRTYAHTEAQTVLHGLSGYCAALSGSGSVGSSCVHVKTMAPKAKVAPKAKAAAGSEAQARC